MENDKDKYINGLIEKIQQDPDHPDVSRVEKVLLTEAFKTDSEKKQLMGEINLMSNEIKECEDKIKVNKEKTEALVKRTEHLQTKINTLVDSIIAVKEVEDQELSDDDEG